MVVDVACVMSLDDVIMTSTRFFGLCRRVHSHWCVEASVEIQEAHESACEDE